MLIDIFLAVFEFIGALFEFKDLRKERPNWNNWLIIPYFLLRIILFIFVLVFLIVCIFYVLKLFK